MPLGFGSGGGPEPLTPPFSPPPPPLRGGEGGLSHEPPPPSPPPPPKLFLSNVSWSKLSKKPPPPAPSLSIAASSFSSASASALAAARRTALRTSSVAATPAATPAAIVRPPRIQVTFLCFLVAVPETTAVMDSASEPFFVLRESGGGGGGGGRRRGRESECEFFLSFFVAQANETESPKNSPPPPLLTGVNQQRALGHDPDRRRQRERQQPHARRRGREIQQVVRDDGGQPQEQEQFPPFGLHRGVDRRPQPRPSQQAGHGVAQKVAREQKGADLPRGAADPDGEQAAPEAEDESGPEDCGDAWEEEGDGGGVGGGEDAPAGPAAVLYLGGGSGEKGWERYELGAARPLSLSLSFVSLLSLLNKKTPTHECRCSHASASFRNCIPRVDTSTVAAMRAARTRARSQFARKSLRTLVPREEDEDEEEEELLFADEEEEEKNPCPPSLRLPPKPPLSLGSPLDLWEDGDWCGAPLRRKGCFFFFGCSGARKRKRG